MRTNLRNFTLPNNDALCRWRREILARRDPQTVAARQGFAALTMIDQSRSHERLVEIKHLLVILAYEDQVRTGFSNATARSPLRLAGYRVSRLPHGVQWGGVENAVLFKNLEFIPRRGARGERVNVSNRDMAALALKLNARLARASRHPNAPWQPVKLPNLWAGFHRQVAQELAGAGPEFERTCCQASCSPEEVWRAARQLYNGLWLYPLEWVDSDLSAASAIFAEFTPSWQRRVFRIAGPAASLVGFQGASSFDFYSSRFRPAQCMATPETRRSEFPASRRRSRRSRKSRTVSSGSDR